MWIVLLALRRPYTFVVLALMLIMGGVYSISRTPTDILPSLDIPVISVVWTYEGLPAQQMERQITQFSEYSLSNNVADIARTESQTFDGISVIRIFLQPDADVSSAMAQSTAASQAIVRRMPPGTQPPIILRYSASSVPILQISFTSDTLSESEIFDHVNQRVRTLVGTVHGTRLPLPAGGRARQITVDLDQDALKTHGLSPNDVAIAVSAQNLTLPTGTAKIGEREYRVSLNSSPDVVPALNDIPIRRGDGKILFLRDVAHVHDGFAVQTNIARQDGKRSVVLSVMKTGDASTTEVAERVKSLIPTIRASAPPGMKVEVLADQSKFVTAAINGLLSEGLIAAALTATMILLFLGSWRSTLIVAISIPLSVLSALIIMRLLGYTLNAMTLGGLALAVGILVDDATVEIENIHRNLAMGKSLTRAILDGAQQIAVPAFVASSCISIVFISVIFLEGPARFLFVPMGVAVGLSVMASYLLSRTVIPTLVKYLLRAEVEAHHAEAHTPQKKGLFARLHDRFNAGFEAFQESYIAALEWVLGHKRTVFALLGGAVILAGSLVPFVGRDFFPTVSAEQIRLHVVAPTGMRIEETERVFGQVEEALRRHIPESERTNILDQIGIPSGYNLAITDSANVSASDGEILVTLSEQRSKSTSQYVRDLRKSLSEEFPDLTFYFQPADIVTQILNFGLPSPIEIQVSGAKRDATYAIARKIESDLRYAPGAVDVRMFQVQNAPRLHFEVDRARAGVVDLTQRDVANNLLLTVASNSQVAPSFWTDPASGNSYPVSVRIPENRINTIDDLQTLSLQTPRGPQLLEDVADLSVRSTPLFVTHVDIQPTFSVRADVQLSDLGSVARSVDAIVAKYKAELPPGSVIAVRGQVESMYSAFARLALGILAATLLVYALLVVNFQSWRDPFIIITALSGAMVGIILGLFVTQTTFSIPSLMGAIMSVGVATANSILVVSFAKEQREQGLSAIDAARAAGRVRLRPVLMTALAMVVGMLPMAIGHGVGSEQNAALGRAVIGGLCGATLATLFIVPLVYSVLAANEKQREKEPDLDLHSLQLQGEGA